VEEIDDIREMYCVMHLDLGFCKALRALPPLGHLTELEHLNISSNNVAARAERDTLVTLI
jgi:hypothetical protein